MHIAVRAISLWVALMAFGMQALAADLVADTVYTGGKIYTSDASSPWARAIALRGKRIIYIGDDAGAKAYIGPDSKVVSLGGRLVLPGLIDAHVHPGYIALTNGHLQIPEATTTEALMEEIRRMVREAPGDGPIIAMPWDNTLFAATGPDKRLLDEIDTDRPLLLWDTWMHSLWVNSIALEQSGIDRSIEDPVPGFSYYQRDSRGELTGYINESAATEFWNLFDAHTVKTEAVLLEFLNYLLERGVTTLFDAGNFGGDSDVYEIIRRLDLSGRLPLRYHGSYTLYLPQDLSSSVATLKKMREEYSTEKLRVDTLKVFLDGVIETRTAYVVDDYVDTPGNKGNILLSREQLHQLMLDLEREGLNIHFHTIGDLATRTALDAVEDVHKTLGRPPRMRIAMSHLEMTSPVDIARFKALGVVAQFTPHWHGGVDDDSYDKSIGLLQDNMYLTKSLVKDGAVVSFSSDAYFTSDWASGNASPFTGIQVGHTRQYVEDGPLGPVSAPASEALSRSEMVDGYTRNAAYQLGIENELGTLEVGKKADFIVLEQNLFEIDKYAIHKLKPSAVVLDGELVSGSL
jgi:predicted amidohydrolase YtcJ